jgi:hypothetical protein
LLQIQRCHRERYEEEKEWVDRSDRIIFTGIGITCLIGRFVLMYLFQSYFLCACQAHDTFEKTATSIVATNNAIATLIQQTNVAATEQFIMTSTALP